jgi:hypothetical protein
VVPHYDDDDIIEDYEEISDADGGARRVASASGGPVQKPDSHQQNRPVRPSDHVRPATTAVPAVGEEGEEFGPPKGKITKKSARNIWIICIAICVLGIGLVLADMIFDVFGRGRGAGPAPNTANNTASRQPGGGGTTRELTPREKLEREFKTDVINQMKEIQGSSKAWDFYWTAVQEFEHAYDIAKELKSKDGSTPEDRKAAWAEAIKFYYKAKYAGELFRYRYDEDRISMDYLPFPIEELEGVPDEELKNPRIRTYQAADLAISTKATNVNRFQTDVIKYELEAGQVHQSEEWEANVFGEWKAKLDAARQNQPVFDEADLEFVNGPDYEPGEEKMYEKFLKENRGE